MPENKEFETCFSIEPLYNRRVELERLHVHVQSTTNLLRVCLTMLECQKQHKDQQRKLLGSTHADVVLNSLI